VFLCEKLLDYVFFKDIDSFVDSKKIFLGYHMNKKRCISIILDGSLSDEFIFDLIDKSFNFSIKKLINY
jgi:predicted DNA-binding protein (MmcQ/YjbR family)